MKKAFAILMSLVLMLSLAVPAMADGETTYTITIDNKLDGHIYEAYQIFTGDLKVNGTDNEANKQTTSILSNIVWGDGITKDGQNALLRFGKEEGAEPYASPAALAEVLTATNIVAFADAVVPHLSEVAATSTDKGDYYEIANLEPGYYLVMDAKAGLTGYDVKTSYIIEVVENSTVSPKSEKPEVDKQVLDETDDAEANHKEGWGETADHAINETFQFKLIATLPEDADFAAYETYKIVFNDTMSEGITFESIASVKVNDTEVPVKSNDNPYGYYLSANAVNNAAGITWTLTIDDIKKYDTDLTNGAKVEVIYNAHLNENAEIGNVDANKNTVGLQYSNNPNVGGEGELGTTPTDTVWVFTYRVDSTKYKNEIADNNKLDGAGFTLYYSADGTTKGNAVKLIFDNGDKVYRPAPADATEGVVTEMTSANGGVFNVVGLDVGTYIMEETSVPAGYNKCDDIVIEITATHAENETSAATNIEMKIDEKEANINNVVNKAGSTLPETGGMGTTIFYIVGGVMVAAAVVLLITKKRMSAEG